MPAAARSLRRLSQRLCEHPGLFFPQQVSLRGVGVAEVRGKLVSYLDTMAKDYLFAGTGEFAADLTPPVDAALLKLAADQPVHVAVNLWAGDRRVAWSGDGAALEVEVIRGPAPTATLGQRATALVQVPAGSEAALWLVLGPTRVALGHVRGVPPGALEQLELVVGYADHPEGAGSRVPLAARAVARDAEGDLVYGAPAEWSVLAGSFAFSPAFFFHEGANNDHVLLFDSAADDEVSPWCFPTPSSGAHAYTGRISARVAGLTAEVDLAWTYAAGGKASPDSLVSDFSAARPGPNCEGPGFDGPTACNCASATDSGPTIVLLALLALGAAGRRRRRRG